MTVLTKEYSKLLIGYEKLSCFYSSLHSLAEGPSTRPRDRPYSMYAVLYENLPQLEELLVTRQSGSLLSLSPY